MMKDNKRMQGMMQQIMGNENMTQSMMDMMINDNTTMNRMMQTLEQKGIISKECMKSSMKKMKN